jgi:hypothetical protein
VLQVAKMSFEWEIPELQGNDKNPASRKSR